MARKKKDETESTQNETLETSKAPDTASEQSFETLTPPELPQEDPKEATAVPDPALPLTQSTNETQEQPDKPTDLGENETLSIKVIGDIGLLSKLNVKKDNTITQNAFMQYLNECIENKKTVRMILQKGVLGIFEN